MNGDGRLSTRDALILLGVLLALVLAGWFVWPGQTGLAQLVGGIAGIAMAGWWGVFREGLPLPVAFGVAIMCALFGWLLRHQIITESSSAGLGETANAVAAATYGVTGLFFGVGIGAILFALLRFGKKT